MASETQAMGLAVNWPPQDPADGQATHSSSCRSAGFISPAAYLPTPSKTSITVTSLPRNLPGRIEPPYMKTDGMFRRTMAIIRTGSDLSQLGRASCRERVCQYV